MRRFPAPGSAAVTASGAWVRIIVACLALGVLAASACRRSSPLSTEEVIGEWRKTDGRLPPISLLVTAEGSGLRARLRLSGRQSVGDARLSGRQLRLDFDDHEPDAIAEFVSKTELDLRFLPAGAVYRLRKRP